jgi:Mn2+/Fe2+ NRAMP family transporter
MDASLVAVQVINGVLLPINLFFIWRLARSEELMGSTAPRRRRLGDGGDGGGDLDALADPGRGDGARPLIDGTGIGDPWGGFG